jgi:hypothetical protein
VASKSKIKATRIHRRRAERGLVRVEDTFTKDAALIGARTEGRGEADKAEGLRRALPKPLSHPEVRTAFDVFGSELPDEAFEGVFDQRRQQDSRELDL